MPFFGPPDIKKLEAKRDVNGLMRALGYKDSSVGRSAARALGRIGAAPEPLVGRLADENEHAARNAEEALVALGPSAVPAVAAALGDQDHFVRDIATESLYDIGSPVVDAALADRGNDVRRVVAEAIAKCAAHREAVQTRKAADETKAATTMGNIVMTAHGAADAPVAGGRIALRRGRPLPSHTIV
jgi:hypothetical protein